MASDEVLIEDSPKEKNVKKITLNRPKAFNALNLTMIRKLTPYFKEWTKENGKIIIMKGAGDKAFCAGGDIRAIYDSGPKSNISSAFFYEEYILNYLIAKKRNVQVSLLNGITMGGGVGLSVHGTYRVAFENTMFAMPETAIGFFPDVGGSYFLPRLYDHWGMYLGLTGARLKGHEVKVAGVATHFCTQDKAQQLEDELLGAKLPEQVSQILDKYDSLSKAARPKEEPEIVRFSAAIKDCFGEDSVEKILSKLNSYAENHLDAAVREWAARTVANLKKMSPTSLKVTHREIRTGGHLDYKDCFSMEYRLSQNFMKETDFFEGVRATLVDKDKNPRWYPKELSEVTKEMVDKYFDTAPATEWYPLSDPDARVADWEPKFKL